MTVTRRRGALSPDGSYEWNGRQWVPRGFTTTLHEYRSPRARATVVVSLLALWTVVTLVGIAAEVMRLNLVNTALTGTPIDQAAATASDHFVQLSAGLSLAVYVPLVITFLMWAHRVVTNSWGLGAKGLRFTPGWAVGWWFIPFANLVQPERAIEETWRVTSAWPSTPDTRTQTRAPVLVRCWWVAWVLSELAGRVLVFTRGSTVSSLHDTTVVAIATEVLGLVAAALAVAVVASLTTRQERLRAAQP